MNGIGFKKLKAIFNKYGGKCAYCGIDLNNENFTIDHITSFLKKDLLKHKNFGYNSIENLNPCCGSCNSRKRSRSIKEFKQFITNKCLKLLDELMFLDKTYKLKGEFDKVTFYFEIYEG